MDMEEAAGLGFQGGIATAEGLARRGGAGKERKQSGRCTSSETALTGASSPCWEADMQLEVRAPCFCTFLTVMEQPAFRVHLFKSKETVSACCRL